MANFDYFSLFPEKITLDVTNYFTNFDLAPDVKEVTLVNFFKKIDIKSIQNLDLNFFEYTLKTGDRLDLLAKKFYGNTSYWWIILIFNTFLSPFYLTLDRTDLFALSQKIMAKTNHRLQSIEAYNNLLLEIVNNQKTIKLPQQSDFKYIFDIIQKGLNQ